MIELSTLKTRLEETGYTVLFSKEKDIDLQEPSELPIIYIGYNNIDSVKTANAPLSLDIYSQNGENLVQSFTIQLLCLQDNFPIVWKAIYRKLIGWNPVSTEAIHTSFTYVQGGVMGLANSKFHWVDIWRVGFPTNSILT
jgi:hypothetical protein